MAVVAVMSVTRTAMNSTDCEFWGGIWSSHDCSCNFDMFDPVVIPLAGPLTLTGPRDGVLFDFDSDGVAEQLAWTRADSNAGFLALDRNGNGAIDDGSELFGPPVFRRPKSVRSVRANGFSELAVLDGSDHGGNEDGRIDARDAAFPLLRLWFDRNHDGLSQPEELVPLAEAGIRSIELTYVTVRKHDRFGNYFRYQAVVHFRDGREGTAWDVFLRSLIR